IAEEFPEGFSGVTPDEAARHRLAAIAMVIHQRLQQRAAQISGTIGNHRRVVGKDWVVSLSGGEIAGRIEAAADGAAAGARVRLADGEPLSVETDWLPGQTLAHFRVGGQPMGVKVELSGTAIRLRWRGMDVTARVRSPRVAALAR